MRKNLSPRRNPWIFRRKAIEPRGGAGVWPTERPRGAVDGDASRCSCLRIPGTTLQGVLTGLDVRWFGRRRRVDFESFSPEKDLSDRRARPWSCPDPAVRRRLVLCNQRAGHSQVYRREVPARVALSVINELRTPDCSRRDTIRIRRADAAVRRCITIRPDRRR